MHRFKALRNRDWLILDESRSDAPVAPSWACPICHTDVEEKGSDLVCSSCGRSYPVNDGVPDFFSATADA